MKEYKAVYDEYRKICKEINKILEEIEHSKRSRKTYYLYAKEYRNHSHSIYEREKKEASDSIKIANRALRWLNNEHIKLSEISREYKQKLRKLSK